MMHPHSKFNNFLAYTKYCAIISVFGFVISLILNPSLDSLIDSHPIAILAILLSLIVLYPLCQILEKDLEGNNQLRIWLINFSKASFKKKIMIILILFFGIGTYYLGAFACLSFW